MLNRIRRTITRTRERYLPKGRHRRALTPVHPTVIHLGRSARPTLPTGQRRDRTGVLPGEDTALVRPYVLASEKRARRHSATSPHDLLTHTWLAPTEAL